MAYVIFYYSYSAQKTFLRYHVYGISKLSGCYHVYGISERSGNIINYEGDIPKEIILEDKSEIEQFKLINQLDEEDKSTVLKIIDTMLTKKKFKDFFNKNVASL